MMVLEQSMQLQSRSAWVVVSAQHGLHNTRRYLDKPQGLGEARAVELFHSSTVLEFLPDAQSLCILYKLVTRPTLCKVAGCWQRCSFQRHCMCMSQWQEPEAAAAAAT
jgi:hypothetical protein